MWVTVPLLSQQCAAHVFETQSTIYLLLKQQLRLLSIGLLFRLWGVFVDDMCMNFITVFLSVYANGMIACKCSFDV